MTLSVHLSHRVGQFDVDVAFDAPPGVTVLFGRSGCGKTTIIQAVAGLLRPDAGRIALDDVVLSDTQSGRFLPPHKRRLGYVFQESRLFPHLTVRQNLFYGRWMLRALVPTAESDRIIDMLGLGALLHRRPAGLSGGEKQRVAIGRALLAKPRLILADEPLAALDDARKSEILPYFEMLRDEVKVPILYVTHSAAEVARLATTVVALENGRVLSQGPAVEVLSDPMVTPAGVRAAGALLQVRVVAHHDDGLSELSAGSARFFVPRVSQAPGTEMRVRVAAQEVLLSRDAPVGLSALNVIEGVVDGVRSGGGPGAIVSLTTDAGMLLARITRRSVTALGLEPGQTCYAVIKALAVAPEDVAGKRSQ